MLHLNFSAPEPLEDRIAPAGLVFADFSQGILTITAADGSSPDVEVVKTGAYTFRIDGNLTDINAEGQTSQSFRGRLTGIVIEGGLGDDTFALTNLNPLKTLSFNGGGGTDSLTTTNLKIQSKGSVNVDLGAETGSVTFQGAQTNIGGMVAINLGGGGVANFDSAVTIIGGAVLITGGDGSDTLSFSGKTALLRNSLTFLGGAESDFINTTGGSLNVQGGVILDGGAGDNSFVFGTDRLSFGKSRLPVAADIKLGAGAGNVSFEGIATKMFGDLKIDLGSGGGVASLESATNWINGNVQVTGGDGNDFANFTGKTTIFKSLFMVGNAGDDSLTAAGGSLTVRGATSMDGGVGASLFSLQPTKLSLAALSVTGGTDADVVDISSDGTISGNVDLQLGLDGIGPSSVTLQSLAGVTSGLKIGGTLTIAMTGATVDALTLINLQVAKDIMAQTGENVSTVTIAKLNALRNFDLKTGAGADVVHLDNVNTRDLTVDLQVGADRFYFERDASYLKGSRVLGIATILAGIGADELRIGDNVIGANTQVSFMNTTTIDAGDGANNINDVLASNLFKKPPTIGATDGGTLTTTDAA